jgi:hypothetical protein
MKISRRSFLGSAAALAVTGCATKPKVAGFTAPGEIKSVLIHLGYNMWCDWFPPDIDIESVRKSFADKGNPFPDTELRCKDVFWNETVNHIADKKMNMVVIDLGEGLVYPSHPELAIKGSWTPDRIRAEIKRLNAMGLEVIPKLNFSTTHNGWLGEYRRYLSTPKYYQVCEDLIRDVAEIFNAPRFFHIGYDEESAHHQDNSNRCLYVQVRKGEFWWHDFLHIVRTVEKHGMRSWAWSDFSYDNREYFTRCPKSVLQCSWYYDESHGGFDPKTNKTSDYKRLMEFWDLENAGFDQTPCGTNWVGWKRKRENAGAEDVIGKLVKLGREVIAPERLKGFMMAPWAACDNREHTDFIKHGVDLFADALEGKIHG